MFSNFFSEDRAIYEKTSKNMVEPEGLQVAIWRMLVACWIVKATREQVQASARAPTPTRTHSSACSRTQKYTILIAFPRQQLFRERLSVTLYVHCSYCSFLLPFIFRKLHKV